MELGLLLLTVCFHLQLTCSQDLQHNVSVINLHNIEEEMLVDMDSYISDKEETLQELETIINQTSLASDSRAAQTIEEYLGNPLNQYLVIKRFFKSWGKLSDFLYSDSSTDEVLTAIDKFKNDIPGKDKLHQALREMEKSLHIDADTETHRYLL